MKSTSLVLAAAFGLFSQVSYAKFIPETYFAPDQYEIEDYQMGSEWGKKVVTEASLRTQTSAFKRAASATALIPVGGTGFYLGKFNGAHVLATNHHVCPEASDCVGTRADFKMLKKKYKISKLYITLPDVDLSLLKIEVPAQDEALVKSVAKNFSFNRDVTKGLELITIGFGVAGGNLNQSKMMGNSDSDCKVFSQTAEYRHLADPDDVNPAPYKAWSFAHACDISHGDSGSAMVDRKTGDVVGIVWTGRIPKNPIVQDSTYLTKLFKTPTEVVWKELSYAVPATKMAEYLSEAATSEETEEETREVFKALLK